MKTIIEASVSWSRTKAVLVAFLFLCGLLTSCTRAIVLQVFNNTSNTLTVHITQGGKAAVLSISKDESGRLQGGFSRFVIACGTNAWNFEPLPVPKTTRYMLSERFGPLVVKLQVQEDGSIYVLRPEAQGTAASLPEQPPGYPLRPAHTKP